MEVGAFCKIAGKVAQAVGVLLASVSRIQSLLDKAAEKPYQAKLLEARLNSCKALLQALSASRMDAVHLEPLRIKLTYIEEMVERAGERLYIYKFTDESLAKEFEAASSQLQEEEATLALVASAQLQALPGQRPRSSSFGRRLAVPQRRRTRSRSSSRGSRGGRSKSPLANLDENTTKDGFAAPSRAQMARAIVTENEHEITLTDAALVDDATETTPLRGGRVANRANSCCSEESPTARRVGERSDSSEESPTSSVPVITVTAQKGGVEGRRTRCSKALIPFDLIADLLEPPDDSKHTSQGTSVRTLETDLPLPLIHSVERESNPFWQDSITLVFRCQISGQEHRVETQQWSRPDCTDTAGDRLMSWASKPFRISKPWEEVMEEGSPSSSEQSELKDLLQKSGWYDKFTFDTDCRSWVAKEVAIVKERKTSMASGYVPCTDD